MKKKRLLVWPVVQLLVGGGAVPLIPTWRYVAWGVVTNDAFHQGMPSQYWLQAIGAGSAEERQQAAAVLVEIDGRNPDVGPALIAALKDEDYLVRKNAAISLGGLASKASPAVLALLETPKDPHPHVRREAVIGLGRI